MDIGRRTLQNVALLERLAARDAQLTGTTAVQKLGTASRRTSNAEFAEPTRENPDILALLSALAADRDR